MNPFSRTEILFGEPAIDKLNKMHVAVFGIGGVGGYVVEALVRSGVGQISIIDNEAFFTVVDAYEVSGGK